MKKTAVSRIMLALLLIGMLTLTFNIQPVGASGTIYIRPDGTVEGTDKIHRDGDVYTFTDNIYDNYGIVVEKDNIVVDGAGYSLQGTTAWDSKGIDMTGRSNVTIQNAKINEFQTGIMLVLSSNNSVLGNNITNNGVGNLLSMSSNIVIYGNNITANYMSGIELFDSSNITINGNNITKNSQVGIGIILSSYNTISGNTIKNNDRGISLYDSLDNTIYHNNFIDNPQQVYDFSWDFPGCPPSINTWDNGYPSGGNYWSDHVTVDDCCGINQDEPGGDGIVDEPYIIDNDNCDNYPLVVPWSPLPGTIDELKTEVERCWSEGEIDNQGIVKSLIAKLNVAQKLVDKGKIDEAKSILEDDFIPQVQNLLGIHITVEAADVLVKSAKYIISQL